MKIYLSALTPPGEYFVYFSCIYFYFFGGTPNSKRAKFKTLSATTNANAAAASVNAARHQREGVKEGAGGQERGVERAGKVGGGEG